ncbi:hypothetical protein VIBNISOn1_1480012 [Vibrio nigripulchritudo SOn1]|uniref:N-acetyltransferase domain-containing protein n=1 Tax=Vibrio nigripulchritudo SOn1 TaxID=1238450 RepID=A0AAV2VLN5_9VIBR|nr:hypothetical protein [Vibrio nigripulchritudo]CCO45438.1 hypothetical protein VIBNISOn1_1480012 [Vibrio nigripulchritudo SOn1]
MTIRVFNASTEFGQYKEARKTIVEIYNEHSMLCHEKADVVRSDFSKPELCWCFDLGEENGGIVVEQFIQESSMAVITFAALAPNMRGEGLIKLLIKFASRFLLTQTNALIVAVQVNPNDCKDIWKHLGFIEEQHDSTAGNRILFLNQETAKPYMP